MEINLAIAEGRQIRKKLKYNPDFPLNISWHEPCHKEGGKLTGIKTTVTARGGKRKEYVCRGCKKRIARDKVHASMDYCLTTPQHARTALMSLKAPKQGNNEATV